MRWQYGAEMAKPYTVAKFPGPKHVMATEQAEASGNGMNRFYDVK